MDTLIVVVSHNDHRNTVATVESLLGQGRIAVWDNASTDSTREKIAALPVDFYWSDENVLWTPACNGAVKGFLEDEEFILFSNNDIVYRPNVVERLKQALDEYDVVAPTGTCLGGLQDYATQWGHGKPAENVDHLPTLRTAYLIGASMMMKREVWEKVGEFDEDMPLGADDHDYCIRAKDAGYRLAVVNSAFVNHKGHASAKHAKKVWDEWGGKSWAVFNEKWAGYFLNEEEALKCHWAAHYYPGWEVGTGWLSEEKRRVITERRAVLSDPK